MTPDVYVLSAQLLDQCRMQASAGGVLLQQFEPVGGIGYRLQRNYPAQCFGTFQARLDRWLLLPGPRAPTQPLHIQNKSFETSVSILAVSN